MTDDSKKCPLGERVYPIGEVPEDGSPGIAVRHHEGCQLDLVPIRRRQPGESAEGWCAGSPNPDGSFSPTPTGHAGPARVTSDAFRSGWDRLFGGKQEVGQA